MEDDMDMNFPELLVKVVYAAGGGEREKSEEAKGLRPIQNYIFCIE